MKTLSPSCYTNITSTTLTASPDATQPDTLSCTTKHKDFTTNKTNSIGNTVMPTPCRLFISLLPCSNSLTPLLTSFDLIVYFPFSYHVPELKWIFGKIQCFKRSLQLPVLWMGNSLFFHFHAFLLCTTMHCLYTGEDCSLLATTYDYQRAMKVYVQYDTM